MVNKLKNEKKSSLLIILLSFLLTITISGIFFGQNFLYQLLNDVSIEEEGTEEENGENGNEETVKPLEKRLYCQYDSTMNYEKSVGGLRIYIPTYVGYINYNLGHSVHSGNCDTWRLTIAYACDDNLGNAYAITPGGEWDMALHLAKRTDFIGGHAHGDEVYTSFSVYIDNVQKEVTTITELTTFEELRIEVESIGYDPSCNTIAVLKHYKEFIIEESGVELNQRVEWLNDYALTSCYMAMMPPLKTLTDSYYTDVNPSLQDIKSTHFMVQDCKTAVLVGKESRFRFSMSIPKYPSYDTGNFFLMTDNSGGAYNKMYFVVCRSANVAKGEIWETTTKYNIIHY